MTYDTEEEYLILGNGYMQEKMAEVWSGETLDTLIEALNGGNVTVNYGGGLATYVEAFDRASLEVTPSGLPLYAFIDVPGTYSLVGSAGDGMFIINKNDPDYATIMENGVMLDEDFCTLANGVITIN